MSLISSCGISSTTTYTINGGGHFGLMVAVIQDRHQAKVTVNRRITVAGTKTATINLLTVAVSL
jgi:hypothetical protein